MKSGLIVVFSIALLMAGYCAGYLATVEADIDSHLTATGYHPEGRYSVGGDVAKVFFWPALQADVRIRQDRYLPGIRRCSSENVRPLPLAAFSYSSGAGGAAKAPTISP